MSEPYWVPLGAAPLSAVVYPGTELAYAQFTAPVAITAVAEASATTVVTAPAITVDGSTAINVEFGATGASAAGTAYIYLSLFQDGVSVGMIAFIAVSAKTLPVSGQRRLTPAAGSRTYSVRAVVSVGTGEVTAGPGAAGEYGPGYIRITKV